MGSCYSQRRTSSLSDADIPCPTVGKNKALKKKLPKWTYDDSAGGAPLTPHDLERMRAEFWDTAPAFEGRKEIWDALRAASTALLVDHDFALAQAIIDGANITLPRGSLTECYDELGARYKIPLYCLSQPSNLPPLSHCPALATCHRDKKGTTTYLINNNNSNNVITSSCCEDDLTTNIEDELDEYDGGAPGINQVCQFKKSRSWSSPHHHQQQHQTTQASSTVPSSSFHDLKPGAQAPTVPRSTSSNSACSSAATAADRPKNTGATTPVVGPPGQVGFSLLQTSTIARLASLVCRRNQRVTSTSWTSPSTRPPPPKMLPTPAQSTVTLKLRIGTSGTDYELSCSVRDTILTAKRRLAKKVLFQRLGDGPEPKDQNACDQRSSISDGRDQQPDAPHRQPPAPPSVTKRDLNRLVEAQRWLLSGKIIPNKITVQEAKIPAGFVVQVAICGTQGPSSAPNPSSLDILL